LEISFVAFVAKNNQAFPKAEAIFREEARGTLLQEIPLWIKVLLVEEGMFPLPLGG